MSRKPSIRLASLRAEIRRAVEAHQQTMAQPSEHAEAETVRRDAEVLQARRAEMLKLPEVKSGG